MWIRVVGEPAETGPVVDGLRVRDLFAEAMRMVDWGTTFLPEHGGRPGGQLGATPMRVVVLIADRFTDEIGRAAGDAAACAAVTFLYGDTDTFRVAALDAGVEDAISAQHGGLDELAVKIVRAMTPRDPPMLGLDTAAWFAVEHTFQDCQDRTRRLHLPDREAIVMHILLEWASERRPPAQRRDLEDALHHDLEDQALRTVISRLRTHLSGFFRTDPLLGNLNSGLYLDPERVQPLAGPPASRPGAPPSGPRAPASRHR